MRNEEYRFIVFQAALDYAVWLKDPTEALLAAPNDEIVSSIAKGKHPIPTPVAEEWGFVLCMGFALFPRKALDFVREWRRR